jgi:hypothetical protein
LTFCNARVNINKKITSRRFAVIDKKTEKIISGKIALLDSITMLAISVVFLVGILGQICYNIIMKLSVDWFLIALILAIVLLTFIQAWYRKVECQESDTSALLLFFWNNFIFFSIFGISFLLCFKIMPGIAERISATISNDFYSLIIKTVGYIVGLLGLFIGSVSAFQFKKNH